jgi:hypothetical protein
MVVNGNCELPLGGFLTDYILVQEILDFKRFRDLVRASGRCFRLVVLEDGITNRYAFVANVGPGIITRG